MAYTTKDAISALSDYLGIAEGDRQVIENTKNRGFELKLSSGEKVVIYTYPLVHKTDGSKTYFDTRDSGPKEREAAWEHALNRGMKYFCLGVQSDVEKYTDYVFSLECDERAVEILSGTKGGERNGQGNQVIIPIDFIPHQGFERIQNKLGVYISAIHRSVLSNYLSIFDNRPYLNKFSNDILKNAAKSTLPDTVNAWKKENPKELRERFRSWHERQCSAKGELFSPSTVNTRISSIEAGFSSFKGDKDYDSIFQIQNAEELSGYVSAVLSDPKFVEYDKNHYCHCSEGLQMYQKFLNEIYSDFLKPCYETSLPSDKPRNRIIFGAPGTGKSYTLNRERVELLGDGNESDYERVTFRPGYSYANFVGTYKPVSYKGSDDEVAIAYEFVPGPFMRVYVKALRNGRTGDPKPFLLIIEEINRAEVAAVFGDVFQLLDRGDNNVSEYPIQASEDIKRYLAKELGCAPGDCSQICIPDNMFIWATMNSADQGVFPMDTAFKRRWDFTYLGIDDSEQDLKGKKVVLGKGENRHRVEWNSLRKSINRFLAEKGINEDKQLGPYFIARRIVVPKDGEDINHDEFVSTFKNKVLMYLFEDAARQKRPSLFAGRSARYSEICRDFDEKGVFVFCSDIVSGTEIERLGADGQAPSQPDGEDG